MDSRNRLFGGGPAPAPRRPVPGQEPPRQMPPSGQAGMPAPRPYDRTNASNTYASNQADYRLQPPSNNSLTSNRSSDMPVSLTFQPIADERERNDFIFGNICAVSPRDFDVSRYGSYIYVRLSGGDMTGDIVVNCRSRPDFAPGKIYLNDRQRRWGGITERATFMGQAYDPFSQGEPAYLGSMTVEVQMARTKDRNTEAKFNQDKLMAGMLTRYMDQIFAPGQIVLMDTGTTQLQLTVKSIQQANLGEKESSQAPTSDPSKRGILHGQTYINFTSAGPNIKFEGSLTRTGGNAPITSDFNFKKMGIGGLDNQFQTIFRRAFATRTLPPGVFEKLGQSHVKGILLYGPPGTGKTLIARKIGQMLNSVEPLVVNGPEILNKYVGASEENIRKLFAPAEKEQKEKGAESQLHIIIFDEFDAICKRRGSGAGGGTGVGDTVVNQLLSKIDGVDQLDNVLIIGMTNRKELIDEALLRPGRMEVHVEISLPDEAGRLDILNIHTKKLQEAGYLDAKVDLPYLASVTKNYSGAELAGLVKAATTYTVTRQSKEGQVNQNIDKEMNVTQEDFELALNDVKAAYGVSDEDLNEALGHGIIKFNDNVDAMIQDGLTAARTVRNSPTTLMTVLLQGSPGAGKTALAAEIARQAEFPFVRLITPQYLVGFRDELGKKERIHEIFSEAYKSKLSLLIIDDIESMVEWNEVGPRFSHSIQQALSTLLRASPPNGHRLLILVTTSSRSTLARLGMLPAFKRQISVPTVKTMNELWSVLEGKQAFESHDGGDARAERQKAIQNVMQKSGDTIRVGIKTILETVDSATYGGSGFGMAQEFAEILDAHVQEASLAVNGGQQMYVE